MAKRTRRSDREKASSPPAKSSVMVEPLEPRLLLSANLPGLHLVDPTVDRFDDQVIHLDFDGAQDVDYNGPVTVEDIDVPAFRAPGKLAGQEQAIISEVLARLDDTFADTGLIFVTEKPAAGEPFSTIYIGGNDAPFAEYGSFLGLAEQVDVGNADASDEAFVFSEILGEPANGLPGYATNLADVIAHETGRLLGYASDSLSPDATLFEALASTLSQTYNGSNQYHNYNVDSGTHTAKIYVPWGTDFYADWYVNGSWKERHHSYWMNNWADFSYNWSFSSGTTEIGASVLDGDGNYICWHQWNVSVVKPDLDAYGVSVSDTTVDRGQSVKVSWTAVNRDAGSAGSSHQGIMWSTNSTISTSDRLLECESLGSMDGYQTDSEYEWVDIPNDANYGQTYYIGVYADYDQEVSESNGSNNASEAVAVTINDDRPDLIVQDIWMTPSSPDSDDTVEIWGRIKNTGDTDAGRFWVSAYVDGHYLGDEDLYWGLDAGDSHDEKIAEGQLSSGWHEIELRADRSPTSSHDRRIDESSESNNDRDEDFYVIQVNRDPTKPGTLTHSNVNQDSARVSWGASTDADGDPITYHIEYGKTDVYGDGWTSGGSTTRTYKTLTGLSPDTRYTVRVKATDPNGGESDWREASALFRTDPAPQVVDVRWERPYGTETSEVDEGETVYLVVEATGFGTGHVFAADVWEADLVDPDDPVAGASNLSVSHYSGNIWRRSWSATWMEDKWNGFNNDPEYFFELDSYGDKSGEMEVRDKTAPGAPEFDSASSSHQPNVWSDSDDLTIYWTEPSDGSGIDGYSVLINNSPAGTPGTTVDTSARHISLPNEADTSALWVHVRAKDNSGNWSSSVGHFGPFKIDDTGPGQPTLLSPGDNSTTINQRPTFDWNDVSDGGSGFDHYEIEVYDRDVTWGDISDTITASQYIPASNIPYDMVYWKVRGVDNLGTPGPWSDEWTLNIVEPQLPIIEPQHEVGRVGLIGNGTAEQGIAYLPGNGWMTSSGSAGEDSALTLFDASWQQGLQELYEGGNYFSVGGTDYEVLHIGDISYGGGYVYAPLQLDLASAADGIVDWEYIARFGTNGVVDSTWQIRRPASSGAISGVGYYNGDLYAVEYVTSSAPHSWDTARIFQYDTADATLLDTYYANIPYANGIAITDVGGSPFAHITFGGSYWDYIVLDMAPIGAESWFSGTGAIAVAPLLELEAAYSQGAALQLSSADYYTYFSSPHAEGLTFDGNGDLWVSRGVEVARLDTSAIDYRQPEIDVERGGTNSVHSHSFGHVTVGQSASQSFTIRNEGDAPLTVSQASGLVGPFSINPVNGSGSSDDWLIGPGDMRQFSVVYQPTTPGGDSAALLLLSDDSDESSYEIALSGTGVNARPMAFIDQISPSVAQPPNQAILFEGHGEDTLGSIVAHEWRSDLDGPLSSSADWQRDAYEFTVGTHQISYRVQDNHGEWSEWVHSSLMVADAEPTAGLYGLPGYPVPAGSTFDVTLTGQDNDENGQSATDGQLRLGGNEVGTPVPGVWSLTAPISGGDYQVEYRVRDDEGTWSPWVQHMLSVEEDPAPFIVSWQAACEHGTVGECLLPVPDDGSFAEPRSSGLSRLLVEFSEAINPALFTPGAIAVAGTDADGNGVDLSSIGISTSMRNGNTVGVIDFSEALPNAAKYAVRVEDVADMNGNPLTGDNDRILTALKGDANGDLRVNSTDLSLIHANRANPISSASMTEVRCDVYVDGRITSTDLSAAWADRVDARFISDPGLPLATMTATDSPSAENMMAMTVSPMTVSPMTELAVEEPVHQDITTSSGADVLGIAPLPDQHAPVARLAFWTFPLRSSLEVERPSEREEYATLEVAMPEPVGPQPRDGFELNVAGRPPHAAAEPLAQQTVGPQRPDADFDTDVLDVLELASLRNPLSV